MADIDVNKCLTTGQDSAPVNKIVKKFENDSQEGKNDISNNSTQKNSYFDFDDSPKKDQKISLQAAFMKFRKDRQEYAKEDRRMRKRSRNKNVDSAHVESLRIKFVEQAKKYFGVPYARKYWAQDTPEYNSPIFLDCCGLVRQVLRDLKKDFGFKIGPWNQAYMFDTLPIIIEKEEDMKPGDLVFMSGLYTNKKNKKQCHNMTHVEIWYGEGPMTIGSRWNNGKVQIFDSYRFEAKSFHSEEYYFRSIDTWLRGICKSFCPQHPWRRSKHKPGKKSIFKPDDDELMEEDEKASGSESEKESDNLKNNLTERTTEKVKKNVVDLVSKDKACSNSTEKLRGDISCKLSEQDYLVKTSTVYIHHDNMPEKKENMFEHESLKDDVKELELTQIQSDLEEENEGLNDVKVEQRLSENQDSLKSDKIDDENIKDAEISKSQFHYDQNCDNGKENFLLGLTQDSRRFTSQPAKGDDILNNADNKTMKVDNFEGRQSSAGKSQESDVREEATCMELIDIEKGHPAIPDDSLFSSSKDDGRSHLSEFEHHELEESQIEERHLNKQKGKQTNAFENSSIEITNEQDIKTPLKFSDQTFEDTDCEKQEIEAIDSEGYINHQDNLLLKRPRISNVTDPSQEFHPNTINMSDESAILYPSRRVIPDDNTSEDDRFPLTEDFSKKICDNMDKNSVHGRGGSQQDIESLDSDNSSPNFEISDPDSLEDVDSQDEEYSTNNTSFTIYDLDIDSDSSNVEFKMAVNADACGDSAYDDECSNPSFTLSDSDCHCDCDFCLQDAPAFQGLELWSSSLIDDPDCHTDLEPEKKMKTSLTGETQDDCLQIAHSSLSLESWNSSASGQSTDCFLGAPGKQDLEVTSKVKSVGLTQDTDKSETVTDFQDNPGTGTSLEFQGLKWTTAEEPISEFNSQNPSMIENNLNQSNNKQCSSTVDGEQIEIPYELKSRPYSTANISEMEDDDAKDNEGLDGHLVYLADFNDVSSTADLKGTHNTTCSANSGGQCTIGTSAEFHDVSEPSGIFESHGISVSHGISEPHRNSEVISGEPVDSDNNQSGSQDSSQPAGGAKAFGNPGDNSNNKNTEEKERKRGGGKRTPGGRPSKLPSCCLLNNKMSTFYIGGGNGAALVEVALLNMGWKRIVDKDDDRFKLKWVECKSKINYQSFREGEQLVNHIPNCHLLTNKLGLVNSLQEYERVTLTTKGRPPRLKISDILPETYKLDDKNDRENFLQTYKQGEIWICKPTGMNQGKGIFLLRTQQEIDKLLSERDEKQQQRKTSRPLMSRIVQRYIHNPLLLDGRKFDIRAYMLIASTTPYLVVYHKGYVRLSCMPYDGDDTNLTTHLTNQYIQKKDPNYQDVKEDTAWSMDKFNDYINEKVAPEKNLEPNWVYDYLTKQMQRMMLHCFNSVKNKLQCKLGYFDLYGLDFMVDTDMKVWMIEINVNPALSTNCVALKEVIPSVVEDSINLSVECFEKSRKHQMLQPLKKLREFTVLYCGSQPNAVQSRSTRSSSPSKEPEKTSIATQSTSKRRSGVSPSRSFVPRTSTTHTVNPIQSKSGSNQDSDTLAKSPYSGSLLSAKQLQPPPKGSNQNIASKSRSQTRKSITESHVENNSKSSAKSSSSRQSVSDSKSVSKSGSDSKANSGSKSNTPQSKNDSKSTSPKSDSDSLKSENNSKSSSANSTCLSSSLKSGGDPKSASPKSGNDSKLVSPKANSEPKSTPPKPDNDPKSGNDSKSASPKSSNDSKSASPKSTSPKLGNQASPTGEVKLKLVHKSKMEITDRGN